MENQNGTNVYINVNKKNELNIKRSIFSDLLVLFVRIFNELSMVTVV